jgi:hypothetical protein
MQQRRISQNLGQTWATIPRVVHKTSEHPKQSKAKCFTGWWYTYPSEKYELVSWDDDIPN